MKMFKMIVIGAVLLMAGIGNVNVMGDNVISDPADMIGSNWEYILMEYEDGGEFTNLMEVVDGADPSVVVKGDGQYYIFFCKIVPGGIAFGGYVTTDNGLSNEEWPGYEGWCDGRIDRDVFSEGESPDYVLTVYDPDGGRFALYNPNTGAFTFDSNLAMWESGYRFMPSGDIEYGGVVGGLLDLDFTYGGWEIYIDSITLIPPVIILTSPEYGAEGVDPNSVLTWDGGTGSTYVVSFWDDQGGPVFVSPEISAKSFDVNGYLDWNTNYSWQVSGVTGDGEAFTSDVYVFTTVDYECSGGLIVGDFNGDCIVNLTDLAVFANSWLVERQKVPKGSGL